MLSHHLPFLLLMIGMTLVTVPFLLFILHDPWPVLRASEPVAPDVPLVTFDSKGFS